jgi:hypothetical protein
MTPSKSTAIVRQELLAFGGEGFSVAENRRRLDFSDCFRVRIC